MRLAFVVFAVLAAALAFRASGDGARAGITFEDRALALGYDSVDRQRLTAGGSYRALRVRRARDRCEIVAIPVEGVGEFWSVVPELVGQADWASALLWDVRILPLPTDALDYLAHRSLRRLRGADVADPAAVVFGTDACLGEWEKGS